MIRVLLVEDQAMVRGALAALLALHPDLEIAGEAGSAEEALELLRGPLAAAPPDVALVDVQLPGISGIELVAELPAVAPQVQALVLTTFARPGYARRALEAGARGFLLKDAPADRLAVAIRRVRGGERVIDPELAVDAMTDGLSPLTERETEVLQAARAHGTVAEIAAALHLAPGTVRNHLSAAIGKVGGRTRAEAVRRAEDRGWL
ncbi:response regulator transcription factor [Patulibacter defluvii]|uniref:response regulator transcription factor n=1 Tax=Patulibacter defluvii TaxID=3095358 RepID=UPI002A762752|nr:response regulator transcription factor [Patulibacter sp. DM4]